MNSIQNQIANIHGWMKIMAICYFIAFGFILIDFAFVFFSLPAAVKSTFSTIGFNFNIWLLIAIGFMVGSLYLYFLLLQWSQAGASYAQSGSSQDLDVFLEKQRMYFLIAGILTIAVFVLLVAFAFSFYSMMMSMGRF